jgi:putative ABC transport system substrate-binding protein
MRRREFIALLGAGAAAWPLVARAQQAAMPVIGVLSGSSRSTSRRPMAAFQRALADSGFIEGQSVTIDYRWAEGRFDLLPAMAADVVRRPVALIVALTHPLRSPPRRQPRRFQSCFIVAATSSRWALLPASTDRAATPPA